MSHVAMELNQCPICGETHSVGVLLHKRLKNIEDQVTGYSLCEGHQELADKGYIALVEADGEHETGTHLNVETPRTGNVAHITKEAFVELFVTPEPREMMFVEVGIIAMLQGMQSQAIH